MSLGTSVLPWGTNVGDMLQHRIRCAEVLEVFGRELSSLISDDDQRGTEVPYPMVRNALGYSLRRFVGNRNTQLIQRAPTHHIAEYSRAAILFIVDFE